MPIRLLTPLDLPAVLAVQRQCYREAFWEKDDTLRRKIAAFPEGCLGLERAGCLGAHVFSQPWAAGRIIPLDDPGGQPPETIDCLYIHELSVAPDWRGTGAARELLEGVFRLAHRLSLTTFALVAVQSSEGFWSRWGFVPVRRFEYAPGAPALYMVRKDP